MIKTQVQIPDELYHQAKRVAKERELSFAEVTRRGLEYITSIYPEVQTDSWELPVVNEGPDKETIPRSDITKALKESRDSQA